MQQHRFSSEQLCYIRFASCRPPVPPSSAHPDFCCNLLYLQQCGQLEKSRAAYERAAQAQEKIGSIFHAGKHLETCGVISKELGQLDKMADFFRQAGASFATAGRITAGTSKHDLNSCVNYCWPHQMNEKCCCQPLARHDALAWHHLLQRDSLVSIIS